MLISFCVLEHVYHEHMCSLYASSFTLVANKPLWIE